MFDELEGEAGEEVVVPEIEPVLVDEDLVIRRSEFGKEVLFDIGAVFFRKDEYFKRLSGEDKEVFVGKGEADRLFDLVSKALELEFSRSAAKVTKELVRGGEKPDITIDGEVNNSGEIWGDTGSEPAFGRTILILVDDGVFPDFVLVRIEKIDVTSVEGDESGLVPVVMRGDEGSEL